MVENIHISNINMIGIPGDAINFNLFYGGKSPLEDTTAEVETNFPAVTEETPQFREIHIENIVCRGAMNAIVLQGLPEMPLRNITLKNVSILSQNGITVTDAEKILLENVRVGNDSGVPLKTFRMKDSQLELLKKAGICSAFELIRRISTGLLAVWARKASRLTRSVCTGFNT